MQPYTKNVLCVSDINRKRLVTPLKTLTGTRKMHCVKGVRTGVVTARNISCFCLVCIGEDEESTCENESAAIVQPFKQHELVAEISDLELDDSEDVNPKIKERKKKTRKTQERKGKRTNTMADLCESP